MSSLWEMKRKITLKFNRSVCEAITAAKVQDNHVVFLHFISDYPCFSTKSTNNMK